jgi:hypothetical protein
MKGGMMTREEFVSRINYIAMCSGGASGQEREVIEAFDRQAAEIAALTARVERLRVQLERWMEEADIRDLGGLVADTYGVLDGDK